MRRRGAALGSERAAGLSVIALLLSSAGSASATPTARFDDPPRGPEASASPPPPRSSAAPPARRLPTGAELLIERGARYAARGDVGAALRAYTEAIALEPTRAEAWLALAALREASGDLTEAERLYGLLAQQRAHAAEALGRRALLRWRLGRRQPALEDLREAMGRAPTDPRWLEQLAGWYTQERQWPAALACWRRLWVIAPASERGHAALQVRALAWLVGEADPVLAPPAGQSRPELRRALAHIAQRTSEEPGALEQPTPP